VADVFSLIAGYFEYAPHHHARVVSLRVWRFYLPRRLIQQARNRGIFNKKNAEEKFLHGVVVGEVYGGGQMVFINSIAEHLCYHKRGMQKSPILSPVFVCQLPMPQN